MPACHSGVRCRMVARWTSAAPPLRWQPCCCSPPPRPMHNRRQRRSTPRPPGRPSKPCYGSATAISTVPASTVTPSSPPSPNRPAERRTTRRSSTRSNWWRTTSPTRISSSARSIWTTGRSSRPPRTCSAPVTAPRSGSRRCEPTAMRSPRASSPAWSCGPWTAGHHARRSRPSPAGPLRRSPRPRSTSPSTWRSPALAGARARWNSPTAATAAASPWPPRPITRSGCRKARCSAWSGKARSASCASTTRWAIRP